MGENVREKNIRAGFLAAALFFLLAAGIGTVMVQRQREKEQEAAFLEEHFYFDTLRFQTADTRDTTGIAGWRDWVDDRLYVFLPAYTQGQPLQLTWLYADRLYVDGAEWKKGDRLKEYALDLEYEFVFADDEGNALETVNVVFERGENLPALFLTTESGSLEAIRGDKEYREAGMYCLLDETGSEQGAGRLEYMKGRGNSTWKQDKKPYRIKLEKKAEMLGMAAAKEWELLANAYDGSHMRNQLVFDMAREAGMAYTPQAAWVDLYVNGSYQGLYQLAEKVELGKGRVDIPKQTEGQSDLSGSYLFLMEDASRYEAASDRFMTKRGQTFVLRSPAPATEEQLEYIASLAQCFEDAVVQKDGVHPDTGMDFTEYIDLDSFAMKYLVEEITKNSDAVTNSQYFYKLQDGESTRLFAGPVWDYDNALGHTNEEAKSPQGLMLDKIRSLEGYSNLWYASLCGQPVFSDRVRELYGQLFSPYLEVILTQKIDGYRELLRQSALMDQIRWKDTDKSFRYQVCQDYDGYVDYLYCFLEDRKAFLDQVYLEGAVYHQARFIRGGPFGFVDFYVSEGEKGPKPPDSTNISWEGQKITGWYYDPGLTQPYDEETPLTEDITLYGKWELSGEDGEHEPGEG